MADIYDLATEREERDRAEALANQAAKAAAYPRMRPMGYCRNVRCAEPFPANDNRLFCNSDCAQEHARLSAL